jgi:MFS family permease
VPLLIILLTGQAMASMDSSILAVASPSLRADLHASGAQLQLIVATYTIAFAALVITGARLGDVLGRRRAFLIGLAGFTVSSLAGGLAPTPAALIAARCAQGATGALMTPQVLSIIQASFDGERRARAIGAYSMILAVGVAAGQILGGLIVGAHLLAAAWRPAMLVNAVVGGALLIGASRWLPVIARGPRRRLDLRGAALLSVALVALVVPLTSGRDAGWPWWVWPSGLACLVTVAAFIRVERRRRLDPLFDLSVLRLPSVAAGVGAIFVAMGCYAGFLISVTLHLQDGLRFSPLHCGLIFALYAGGFAAASLSWTRLPERERLPVVGPPLMGAALLSVGLLARGGGWPLAAIAPLLFSAGAGHALTFSPLANRLTLAVRGDQAADVSGLVMTSSLIGQVVGVAAFTGVYLSGAAHGSADALARTTVVLAMASLLGAVCALVAARRPAPLAHPAGAAAGSRSAL